MLLAEEKSLSKLPVVKYELQHGWIVLFWQQKIYIGPIHVDLLLRDKDVQEEQKEKYFPSKIALSPGQMQGEENVKSLLFQSQFAALYSPIHYSFIASFAQTLGQSKALWCNFVIPCKERLLPITKTTNQAMRRRQDKNFCIVQWMMILHIMIAYFIVG